MADQIYLFYGEEDFLIDEKISELKKSINDPALNIEHIDGERADLETMVAALQSQALLFGGKLVIVRDMDLKDPVWDKLAPCLADLPPGVKVVFRAASVDRRSKFFKLIDKLGEVCEFKSFTDWEQGQVVAWIVGRAAALGKQMGRPAAVKLQEICGNALGKLASEIDKLMTYVGPRGRIEERDVEVLASPGQLSVFALSDAVGAKDLKGSLAAFRLLQKNKLDYLPVLALLANRYRILLLGKSLRDPLRVAQTLKASPYYVKKCLAGAGRFTEQELRGNLNTLLEADLRLKSGESQDTAFELLLADLCGVK